MEKDEDGKAIIAYTNAGYNTKQLFSEPQKDCVTEKDTGYIKLNRLVPEWNGRWRGENSQTKSNLPVGPVGQLVGLHDK